jgi:hypothetical protein
MTRALTHLESSSLTERKKEVQIHLQKHGKAAKTLLNLRTLSLVKMFQQKQRIKNATIPLTMASA